MKEIKLFNRDGADLKLVQKHLKEIEPYITEWELKVDKEHSYVLEFCRFIGEHQIENNKVNWDVIEAIDPSGGPFISLGDEFENKYKIVKINSANSIWISERNND
jgi:hypothetical protein